MAEMLLTIGMLQLGWGRRDMWLVNETRALKWTPFDRNGLAESNGGRLDSRHERNNREDSTRTGYVYQADRPSNADLRREALALARRGAERY